MIKKVTLALAFSLLSLSAYAAELVEIKEVPAAQTALILPDAISSDEALVTPEQPAGVLAWVKRHKILTAVLAATVLGASAVAGTLYVSPTARQKAQEALNKVGSIVKRDSKEQPDQAKPAPAL